MATITTVLGPNSALVKTSANSTATEVLNAIDAVILNNHGWVANDSTSSWDAPGNVAGYRIYKSLNNDEVTYKKVIIQLNYGPSDITQLADFNIAPSVFMLSDYDTFAPSNKSLATSGPHLTTINSDMQYFYIFVSPKYLAITVTYASQSGIGDPASNSVIGVFELTKDDPNDITEYSSTAWLNTDWLMNSTSISTPNIILSKSPVDISSTLPSETVYYCDFNNNVTDKSGKGHTVTGTPAYSNGRYLPNGLYSTITINGAGDFLFPSDTPYSIDMWVYTGSNGPTYYYTMSLGNITMHSGSYNGGPPPYFTVAGTTLSHSVAIINSWMHLVLSRDSNNSVSFFINGTKIGSSILSGSHGSNTSLVLTRNVPGGGNNFISELRVIKGKTLFDRPFLPPEIPPSVSQALGKPVTQFGKADYVAGKTLASILPNIKNPLNNSDFAIPISILSRGYNYDLPRGRIFGLHASTVGRNTFLDKCSVRSYNYLIDTSNSGSLTDHYVIPGGSTGRLLIAA